MPQINQTRFKTGGYGLVPSERKSKKVKEEMHVCNSCKHVPAGKTYKLYYVYL